MSKKAMTTVQPKELSQLPVPEDMIGLAQEEAHAGFEGAKSRDDYAIPFLTILQPLSPQVDPGSALYIDGAKPGMILNTVTGELSLSVRVIPVRYARSYIEWVPRTEGGGFRGEHGAEMAADFERLRDMKTGKAKLPNGNDLVDTRSYYVLVVADDGSISPAIISMGSTQIKKARQWLTLLNGTTLIGKDGKPFVAPMFSSSYVLTTIQQENKKGKWYGWNIRREGYVQDKDLYLRGSTFNKQITSGAVNVDRSQLAPEDDSTVGEM